MLKEDIVINMTKDSIFPEKENLRKAVKWIDEKKEWSLDAINQASLLYDLSPYDEEFLIRHFLHKKEKNS